MFTPIQHHLSRAITNSRRSSEETFQREMNCEAFVPYHGHLSPEAQEAVEDEWKYSPRLLQELYELILSRKRDIQTFHLWLYMLDYNLTPNMRDLSVDYQSIDCMHQDYSLVRLSFRASADSMNRKNQIQVLAFDDVLGNDYHGEPIGNISDKVPWGLFLQQLEHHHQLMYQRGELDGDYDCYVAYRQYARLYTLHGAERPNIRQCWVRFTDERMRLNNIQPLATDPNDSGPLFEFKVHHTLIEHLLRAFAWNINIPYMRSPT